MVQHLVLLCPAIIAPYPSLSLSLHFSLFTLPVSLLNALPPHPNSCLSLQFILQFLVLYFSVGLFQSDSHSVTIPVSLPVSLSLSVYLLHFSLTSFMHLHVSHTRFASVLHLLFHYHFFSHLILFAFASSIFFYSPSFLFLLFTLT